jgi:sec-independent protein translocase protein TatA
MDIGLPELLIILFIVLVLFGGSRISKLGGELGSAIRSFKEGLHAENRSEQNESTGKEDQKNNLT